MIGPWLRMKSLIRDKTKAPRYLPEGWCAHREYGHSWRVEEFTDYTRRYECRNCSRIVQVTVRGKRQASASVELLRS